MIRPVSSESIKALGKASKRFIYSKFTVDRFDCECKARERDLFNKSASLSEIHHKEFLEVNTPIECRNILGKKKYSLSCPDCKEIVATLYASNQNLDNYANLHYVCWHDTKSWHGTFGVNVNPSTEEITIECCCGRKSNIKNYIIKGVK